MSNQRYQPCLKYTGFSFIHLSTSFSLVKKKNDTDNLSLIFVWNSVMISLTRNYSTPTLFILIQIL